MSEHDFKDFKDGQDLTSPRPSPEGEGVLLPTNLNLFTRPRSGVRSKKSDEKQEEFALTAANFAVCIATGVYYLGTVQFSIKDRMYHGGLMSSALFERSASLRLT